VVCSGNRVPAFHFCHFSIDQPTCTAVIWQSFQNVFSKFPFRYGYGGDYYEMSDLKEMLDEIEAE
jgi:hypothetical protein